MEKLSEEVQEVMFVTLTAKAMSQQTTAVTAPIQDVQCWGKQRLLTVCPQLRQSK